MGNNRPRRSSVLRPRHSSASSARRTPAPTARPRRHSLNRNTTTTAVQAFVRGTEAPGQQGGREPPLRDGCALGVRAATTGGVLTGVRDSVFKP